MIHSGAVILPLSRLVGRRRNRASRKIRHFVSEFDDNARFVR